MSSVTQAAAHRRGRSLTGLSGAGPDLAGHAHMTASPRPLHSCRRCGAGRESVAGSYDPKVLVLGARHLAQQAPSERGSE
jgi:hypothetical protein